MNQHEPKKNPLVTRCEDGSILLEWLFKDWRIGISIEKNRAESSWYIVARKDKIKLPKGGIS